MRNPAAIAGQSYRYIDSLPVHQFARFVLDANNLMDQYRVNFSNVNSASRTIAEDSLVNDILKEIHRATDVFVSENTDATDFAVESYRFVLVAWSDEYLMKKLKELWPEDRNGTFERHIYGTNNAGELFFEKIDSICSRARPSERGVAAVFLISLLLGFEGRYLGISLHEGLKNRIRELRAISLELAPAVTYPIREFSLNSSLPVALPAVWERSFKLRIGAIATSIVVLLLILSIYWAYLMPPLQEMLKGVSSNTAQSSLRGKAND